MFVKSVWCLVIYLSQCLNIKAELYSALSELEALKDTQESVIASLDEIINKENCKIKALRDHLNQFRKEHEIAKTDFSKYLENHVNCFRLIKRLTIDLESIEEILNERMISFTKDKSLKYPTRKDLDGAAEAFFVLCSTYNLNVTEMSDGILNITVSKYGQKIVYTEFYEPMDTDDCFEVGKALSRRNYHDQAVIWMNEAIRKDNKGTTRLDGGSIRDDILWHIQKAKTAKEGYTKEFINWYYKLVALNAKVLKMDVLVLGVFYRHKYTPEDVFNTDYFREIAADEKLESISHDKKTSESAEDFDRYSKLCRGETTVSTKITKKLGCFYAYGPHPYLRLARLKVEQLYRAPDVIMFYDVISDEEIQVLKHEAMPKLKLGSSYGGLKVKTRVCKTAQLRQSDIQTKIRRRISAITNMDLKWSMNLGVLNYGIAGMFAPHYDFLPPDEQHLHENGNRIATFMVYMTNVGIGGATVFSSFNLTVNPVKGAALLWPNLNSAAEGDLSTIHASCPVIRGNKWILVQWISDKGQELKLPCPVKTRHLSFKYLAV